MNKVDTIQEKMKEKGLRITPQRYSVYANLLARYDHPTVEDILKDINHEIPIASKASVYSALTVLREVGLIREILLQEGVTRYDAKTEPHHHFICEDCGAIIDLDWGVLGELSLERLPKGLEGESYELTVKGKCQNCD
jgi:Fe2+ or Zn2+ uptake regulation protein